METTTALLEYNESAPHAIRSAVRIVDVRAGRWRHTISQKSPYAPNIRSVEEQRGPRNRRADRLEIIRIRRGWIAGPYGWRSYAPLLGRRRALGVLVAAVNGASRQGELRVSEVLSGAHWPIWETYWAPYRSVSILKSST